MAFNWRELIEKVEPEIRELVEKSGYRFVDLVVRSAGRTPILSVIIHKEPSVTIGDCERMSRRIEVLLDSMDLIPVHYILEVSSPGLDRNIRRDFEYDVFKGRIARIVFVDNEGKTRTVEAELVGRDGDELVVKMGDSYYRIPLSHIRKATLIPQI